MRSPSVSSPRSSAFSVLELLVALAVVSIMSVLFVQMITGVSRSWAQGRQLADNLEKGRSALDLIARDLQTGVFRSDLGAFTLKDGTSSTEQQKYCFYTMRSGGADRSLSLVNYRMGAQGTLERQVQPVAWSNASGTSVSFGSQAIPEMEFIDQNGTATELVTGVLAFRMYFVNVEKATGKRTVTLDYVNTPTEKTAAIGVALIVVDEATQKLLKNQGNLEALMEAGWDLPADLRRGLAKHWNDALERYLKSAASRSLPSTIRTGIRVFECVVPISSDTAG